MRTSLLLTSTLLFLTSHAQVVLVDENFDSYSDGAFLAQSAGAPWTTWSAAPGTSEDATISAEQAASGTLSGKWVSTATNGGPTDILVPLGNQTTGTWVAAFQMFIPSTKGGYFNILHNFNGNNSVWAIEVTFNSDGTVSTQLQGQSSVAGNYPHDEWFLVTVAMDLDNDEAVLVVDGNILTVWPFSWNAGSATPATTQLGGLNFYAYAGGGQTTYYIDDLFVAGDPTTGIHDKKRPGFGLFPNPAADQLTVILDGPGHATLWTIRDAAGREVRAGSWNSAAARQDMGVAGLPAGLYVFELMIDGQRRTQRLVKH